MIDINNLGTFSDINAVWAAYPEGGNEGDYLYIGTVKYRWNKYERIWQTAGEVTESPARKLVTNYGDMAVNNDLRVGGTLYYHRLAGYDLGLFSSSTALSTAHPTPKVGQWAFVVHPTVENKYQIYSCATAGTWTLSVSETALDVLGLDQYTELLEMMQAIAAGKTLTGYRTAGSVDGLPVVESEIDPTLGWIVGGKLYVYVGTGGDTRSGKYQNCGFLRGEKGEKGNKGDDAVVLEGVNLADNAESIFEAATPSDTIPTANAIVELSSVPSEPTVSLLSNYSIENGNIVGDKTGWGVRYFPVAQNEVVTISFTSTISKTMPYGFTTAKPASGVSVSYADSEQGTNISITKTALSDGWFVFAFYSATGTNSYTKTINTPVRDKAAKVGVLDYASNGISPLQDGVKVSVMGNSICTFSGYLPEGNRTKYPDGDVTQVEQTWWWQLIKSIKGTLEVNNSYSAGRVTNTHETYPSYIDRYEGSGIGSPDVLILWGGINDMRNGTDVGVLDFDKATSSLDESTFAGAWDKLVRLIMADHPTCKIVSVVEPFLDDEYKAVIMDTAEHYNLFACIDLSEKGVYIGRLDSLHPNANGMRYIANSILDGLDNGTIVGRNERRTDANTLLSYPFTDMDNVYKFVLSSNSSGQKNKTGSILYKAGRPLVIELGGYITRSSSGGVLYMRWLDVDGDEVDEFVNIQSTDVYVPRKFTYTPSVDGRIYVWWYNTTGYKGYIKVHEPMLTASEMEHLIGKSGIMAGSGQSGGHTYSGERVFLKRQADRTYTYDIRSLFFDGTIGSYSGHAAQGFTCWGETGFVFYDGGYCQVLDMENATITQSFALPAPVCNPNNHCGQANWGTFYDADDDYPLLYLSSYLEKCCYVLRMTTNGATLVQTIHVTNGTSDLDAQAFFVDGKRMIVKMGGEDMTGYSYKYWKVFNMPSPEWGEVVYLEEAKKIDEFYLHILPNVERGNKNYYNAGFAQDGKIYVLAGFSGTYSRLQVIDYERHKLVSDIKWDANAMTRVEQEQCCLYGDGIAINYNSTASDEQKIMLVTFR